jgi:hypothetical protein
MPARIEEHAYLPVGPATHNHRLFSHKAGNKVARVRQLAFMSDVQPASREDPFLLRLMDFRIGKNPWTDGPALEIYEVFRIDQLIWLRLFRAYFECLAHLTNSPKPPDE